MDIQCCAPDNTTGAPNLLPTGHVWRFTPTVTVLVT